MAAMMKYKRLALFNLIMAAKASNFVVALVLKKAVA